MGKGILIGEMYITFVVNPTYGNGWDEDVIVMPARDAIFEYAVKEFSDRANGSAWYVPTAKGADVVIDSIAKNKSLALRLYPIETIDRLRDAEKNRTKLSSVVFAIVEARYDVGNSWHNAGNVYRHTQVINAVQLLDCRVIRTVARADKSFEVSFTANSVSESKRGGCDEFGCGSNHNETVVRDTAE